MHASVVYAEDDENDVLFFRLAYERAGIPNPLVVVPDGEAAVEYLSRQHSPPGLLVTDLKMPKMTGLELLAWLREQPQFSSLPAVVLSSSSQESDKTSALELGAREYYIKPSDLKELFALVEQLQASWLGPQALVAAA